MLGKGARTVDATQPPVSDSSSGSFWSRWRPGRSLLFVAWVVIAVIATRSFLAETFVIPSQSMQPGLEPGDRVLVRKVGSYAPTRGDVVVFNGAKTFGRLDRRGGVAGALDGFADLAAGRRGSSDYVKRVIGVSGDRVTCCNDDGQVMVNGQPLGEPYLFPGDHPSDVAFDVYVPEGRLWLMGDHRSESADSRSHLGDAGGGMVGVADVVGPVSFRFWPVSRLGRVDEPAVASTAAVTTRGRVK